MLWIILDLHFHIVKYYILQFQTKLKSKKGIDKDIIFNIKVNTSGIIKTITFFSSLSFVNCYSLCNITLPDELLYIGEKCFLNCVSLNNIKIPKNVYLINESAFENCPIDTLFIPSSVNAIGINAFKGIRNVVFEERKEFMYETFGCSNISFLN